MRPHRTLFLVWALSGVGAFVGSVIGGALGKNGLFVGGAVGGVVAAWISTILAVRFGWLPREGRTGAIIGAVVGFGLACLVTVFNLHTPIAALLSPALAGAGALLGSGIARRP